MKKFIVSLALLLSFSTTFISCRDTKKADDAQDVVDDVQDAMDDATDEVKDAVEIDTTNTMEDNSTNDQ